MATSISDHAHLKAIVLTFNFPEFAPACKISVDSIYSFLRYSQSVSKYHDHVMPISDHARLKIFWSTFIYVNLYQQAKNLFYTILLNCSADMGH